MSSSFFFFFSLAPFLSFLPFPASTCYHFSFFFSVEGPLPSAENYENEESRERDLAFVWRRENHGICASGMEKKKEVGGEKNVCVLASTPQHPGFF